MAKHKPEDDKNKHEDPKPEENASGNDGNLPAEQPMVGLTMEEYDALQREAEQNKAKAAEYFEGWQRERADFANYKRRIERDAAQTQQNMLINVIKNDLLILDDLERALKAKPMGGDAEAWADGIELIFRKMQGMLDAQGLQRMEAENEMFDPNRHEAVVAEDSPDHESGQIIEVLRPGYMLGDRVVRPAQVRVAR